MTKLFHIGMIAVIALAISGCGERTSTEIVGDKAEDNKVDASDETLVTVGTASLTRNQVEKMAQLRAKMAKLSRRNISSGQLDRIAQRAKKEAVPFFVQSRVYSDYLSSCGVTVDQSELDEYKASMAKSYKAKDFGEIKTGLTDEEVAMLEDQILGLLSVKKAKATIVEKADIHISDEEIDEFIAKVDRMNAISAATNAVVYAHATNVWQKIASQETTFEEAVEDFSEDESPDEGGEWGRFSLENLRDEATLVEWLLKLTPGAVTPPIECDNGLAIIKLLEPPTADNPTYRVARVFFRLPLSWEQLTREDALEVLTKRAENAAIKNTFEELASKAGIVNHTRKDKKKQGK